MSNTLLNEYIEQIKQDVKIDDFNIKAVQLTLPAKKHYWATKLILHKKELNDFITKRKQLIKESVDKIIQDEKNVNISRVNVEKSVANSKTITTIDNNIKELGYIIELLEKTEQIFKSISFDIKNIIEINKLEQL